MNQKTILNTEH